MDEKPDVQEIKKQFRNEIAAATYQELVEDMADKCYSMCIKKPGAALDSYEQRCLGNCMDRFIDSYNVVTKEFTKRLSSQMG